MSPELIAILVTALLQSAMLVAIVVMIRRVSTKQIADDAAIFLQGRKVEETLKEMREFLRTGGAR
jgi:hypothetical protein